MSPNATLAFKNLVNAITSPMMESKFVRLIQRTLHIDQMFVYILLTSVSGAFICQAYFSDPVGFVQATTASSRCSVVLLVAFSTNLLLDRFLNVSLRLSPDERDLEAQHGPSDESTFTDTIRFGPVVHPDVNVFNLFADLFAAIFNTNKTVTNVNFDHSIVKPYLDIYMSENMKYQQTRFDLRVRSSPLPSSLGASTASDSSDCWTPTFGVPDTPNFDYVELFSFGKRQPEDNLDDMENFASNLKYNNTY